MVRNMAKQEREERLARMTSKSNALCQTGTELMPGMPRDRPTGIELGIGET